MWGSQPPTRPSLPAFVHHHHPSHEMCWARIGTSLSYLHDPEMTMTQEATADSPVQHGAAQIRTRATGSVGTIFYAEEMKTSTCILLPLDAVLWGIC